MASSGGNVTLWQDQIASLTLAPVATGPATGATINGKPVLTFTAGGFGNSLTNFGAGYPATPSPDVASPWEITAFVQPGSDVNNGNPFFVATDSGTERGIGISGGQWELSWNSYSLAGTPSAGSNYVVTALFSDTGQSAMWINGNPVIIQTGAAISVAGISIGGFGGSAGWSGKIGDVIYYLGAVPTDAQRQANELWLHSKYGF